jgi:predicted RNase H-related nuclease YkuK (DUF458 family)
MHKKKIEEIKEFIATQSALSKVYLGCDSISYKRKGEWFADYYLVVVIHKDCRHGCKIFGEVVKEKDYNHNKKKPTFRLMNEVFKVAELYLQIADIIGERPVEIHLDLNPDKRYASSLVVDQAIGYIKGTCNVIPIVKPDAFVATHAADRMLRIKRA